MCVALKNNNFKKKKSNREKTTKRYQVSWKIMQPKIGKSHETSTSLIFSITTYKKRTTNQCKVYLTQHSQQ
jgi:hypothetical protein